jgi:hypothetical protein
LVPKYVTDEAATGETAVAIIALAVRQMGHEWHPTSGNDSGIDGEIELRDPGTGEVRNVRIAVQSKGTERTWDNETAEGFSFSPKLKDIEYWLSSNQPVILVCVRPSSKEAYWRSVQGWARDPEKRATRAIQFDKDRDRFDATARDVMFDLRASDEDRTEPPTLPAEPEMVVSNLMPIYWPKNGLLHSVHVGSLTPSEMWQRARKAGVISEGGFVFRDGDMWSLRPFPDDLVGAIEATKPKRSDLTAWLTSDASDDLDLVRELVRRDLVARHSQVRWHAYKKVVYFERRGEWEKVKHRWSSKSGRAVVSPQKAKTREGYTGYRHEATEIAVRRLDGKWHAQLAPTYLFTWDGQKVSGHHASALAYIQRKDKHAAVSQRLRMWADLFQERLTLEADDEPFSLGPLVEFLAPTRIPDKGWRELTARDLGVADVDDEDEHLRLITVARTAA